MFSACAENDPSVAMRAKLLMRKYLIKRYTNHTLRHGLVDSLARRDTNAMLDYIDYTYTLQTRRR